MGLKYLAHEFAGNWAVEVKDIRKVPLHQLLQYNLVDALSTNYVKNKYWPMMVADNQLDLYNTLMMPSIKLILQIELTGMPINMPKVQEARAKLEDIMQTNLDVVHKSPIIGSLNLVLQKMAWDKDYDDRRKKAKNPDNIQPKDQDVFTNTLNPNSGNQLQVLLYELMGLPVLDKTDTGQPATGAATLEKLVNHTTNQEYKEIIQALINYGKVSKILSTFIPAFERSLYKGNGTHWLHGNFNLGGTVSGRLSSSDPNLTNLPAGSTYGELIKECFMGPEGYLFCGADFASLEAMIDALTTKDTNKLKVFTDGYDNHSYNAIAYWPDHAKSLVDKLTQAEQATKFYLVEYADGTKEYVC